MNLTLYFKGGFGPCSKKTGLEKREQQHDKKTTTHAYTIPWGSMEGMWAGEEK